MKNFVMRPEYLKEIENYTYDDVFVHRLTKEVGRIFATAHVEPWGSCEERGDVFEIIVDGSSARYDYRGNDGYRKFKKEWIKDDSTASV